MEWAKANAIDFVVVGPEDPLTAGVVDALEEAKILAFGPNKAAAELEGSKAFMKDILQKYNVSRPLWFFPQEPPNQGSRRRSASARHSVTSLPRDIRLGILGREAASGPANVVTLEISDTRNQS